MANSARVSFAPAPRQIGGGRSAARPSARPWSTPRRVGPSCLTRLARLLRLGHVQAGQLTAEDLRVLACLGAALVIALGGQIDLDAPAAVEAPAALPAATPGDAPAAAPAPTSGGKVDDPTSKGTITAVTAHGLAEIRRQFGPQLRGASCWDLHAWNPNSDHPKGRACDVYTSPSGKRAAGPGLDAGNQLVAWLRANHDQLRVSYVIWQGRIWSQEKGDQPYNGGGVYDPHDVVGGHFDHIHVSFDS